MALNTVADYVWNARVLLQDTVVPYRYPDVDFLFALNVSVGESKRIRPDMWLGRQLPVFEGVDATQVDIDEQFRMAFLFFIVGYIQIRDNEDEQDARALVFLRRFTNTLVGNS